MFGNKLMTALVTLKTRADQQSAWGISLKVVLVVVQCMRQYTDNSPGCNTAEYTNVGGRRQCTTQSWKPFLARWTETDRIGTVTGRIGTQITVRLSRKIDLVSESMQSPTHIERSSVFPPQETGTDTFFSSNAKFIFSFFFQFFCEGCFFFGQSSKCLSAGRLRCEHRHFYMVTSVGLVSYILAALGLVTKQNGFLAQPYAWLARIALQNFTRPFSPATISLASLHETHGRARH